MCPPNIVLWCFVLLLVASFSKSQENSMNGHEWSDNSTVRPNSFVSFTKYQNDGIQPTQCNSCDNSTKNDDEMRFESHINSAEHVKDDRNNKKNNDTVRYESRGYIKTREQSNQMSKQMSMKFRANSTEISDSMLQEIIENLTKIEGDESDSTSNELYGNSNMDDYSKTTANVVPYEACDNVTCIQLCCPFGNIINERRRCAADQNNYSFPSVTYGNDSEGRTLDELFPLTVRDPCVLEGFDRLLLSTKYRFLINDSLYPDTNGKVILPTSYCLAIFRRDAYDVIMCAHYHVQLPIYISVCLLLSLPFFLLTFVVYSILPEFQNMHGYTLRAHIASLFLTYTILYFAHRNRGLADWEYCVPLGIVCMNFIIMQQCSFYTGVG